MLYSLTIFLIKILHKEEKHRKNIQTSPVILTYYLISKLKEYTPDFRVHQTYIDLTSFPEIGSSC